MTTYGPGPCVAVGSVVACIGLVASSYAVNLPMVILLIGIVSGKNLSNDIPIHFRNY